MSGDPEDNEDTDLDDLDTDSDSEDDDIDEDQMVDGAHEVTVVDEDIASLVARLDATDSDDSAKRREIRRRLEELREQRESLLDDTFNFNLDDDI